MKNTTILFTFLIIVLLTACNTPEPPVPYGAVPTSLQVKWHQMEYYMFIHFGPNTFTDKEWGHGDEDPKVFSPTHLDCGQWARIARDAGMNAIIITAKHHDGFCLWPSQYSTHTVRESAWKDGKGDILRELSDACKEYGLKFGVYLSPWDRNHPTYGSDEYNTVFANTLTEALSNYGPVFEQWFDGANGEGPNGKLQVYDWEVFRDVVHKLQPDALIFGGPYRNIRWVGNEQGYAGETNWATFTSDNSIDGASGNILASGTENGKEWLPAEVDVSIRPGWFFSPSTNDKVKSLGKLLDIYYSSVGRNGNLLLNVPPDRRGLIHPNDSAHLMELRRTLDATFTVNLAQNARLTSKEVRGQSSKYGVKKLTDGNFDTYWATDDGKLSSSVEIDLKKAQTFNRIVLQEYIPLGQRVKVFSVEYWNDGAWQLIDRQTTIGYKRILCFPEVTAQRVRVNIEESLACPVISEIGIYKAPEILATPVIGRTKQGQVYIHCESTDPVVYYTVDGTEPTVSSKRYTDSFNLPQGGIVQAKAFINNNKQSSETVREDYDLAPAKWMVMSSEGRGMERAVDGNPYSVYTLPEGQTAIVVNFGEELRLNGFTYTPVNGASGNIYRYNFFVSRNGQKWDKIESNASFDNINNNPVQQFVRFDQPVEASCIKLEATETVEPGKPVVVGEIGVLTK
ncbi:MAG: alpha-L-fucosidase [Bacteroidales bacterium]|jgi:alpha-L-fucosidase|nr:alpha-L-fucosidase [Bacteroidales bacterium]